MVVNIPYDWKCQPEAERFILDYVEEAVMLNSYIDYLERQLLQVTSTRLFDWLDHIIIKDVHGTEDRLSKAGFVLFENDRSKAIYYHPGAQLPRVVLSKNSFLGLAVNVDSIADFLLAQGGIPGKMEGTPYGRYRKYLASRLNNVSLYAVERRATFDVETSDEDPRYPENYLKAAEIYSNRYRAQENETVGMQEFEDSVKELIGIVDQNVAAWIVLEVERKYWQSRNTAAQMQKNRQDRLGLGWANHDHHTFRSSRLHFKKLVQVFEMLGFHCRERFYAGLEAGWGAQVMENPVCRLVLFLDVDLEPHEIDGDFAHEQLPETSHSGTIGLWCALHGDSILKAGMHHLEAQFMFDELTHDLNQSGIKMMHPFSFFPYLKQAFTVGEIWPVDEARIQKLLKDGKITEEHALKFREQGGLGSHLENLQRREGYKGFNQKNVSLIIKKTDPRNQ